MKTSATFLLLAFGLAACSRQEAEMPDCAIPIDESSLSTPVVAALRHAHSFVAAECKEPGMSCQYSARQIEAGGIYIHVDFIFSDVAGECSQMPGGCESLEYNAAGVFKDRGICI